VFEQSGKLLLPKLSREDLKEEGFLVGSTAGGVELGHIGIGQATQALADAREGVIPCDGLVGIASGVIGQWMPQTALAFQAKVAPIKQLFDGVVGKKLRSDAFARRFPSHRLRAVLTELESGGVLLVRPGAARAIKAVGLVHAQQREQRFDHIHLVANGERGGF
jgi:hypothetical protein